MIVVSIFRDASDYVTRYAAQIEALRLATAERVHCVTIEGDSTDNSYRTLKLAGFDPLKVEHGGPKYESTNDARRWRQVALVCNIAWTVALREVAPDETIIYIESDLIWEPETILALDRHMEKHSAIAPMSFRENSRLFYDIWGHRKDEIAFGWRPPYHPRVNGQITEIDSAGSCFAVHASVANAVEFSLKDCIRGVGRSLRAAGHTLMLDPTLAVYHPWSDQ